MDTRTRAGQQLYFAPLGILELDERGALVDANLYTRVLVAPTLGEHVMRLSAVTANHNTADGWLDRLTLTELRPLRSAPWGDVTAERTTCR